MENKYEESPIRTTTVKRYSIIDNEFLQSLAGNGRRSSIGDGQMTPTAPFRHSHTTIGMTASDASVRIKRNINEDLQSSRISEKSKLELKPPKRNSLKAAISYISDRQMSTKTLGFTSLNYFELIKLILQFVIENYTFSVFMMIIIVWALFNDYIRLLLFNKSSDNGFYVLWNCINVIFVIEMIASAIYNRKYFNIPKLQVITMSDMYRIWIRRCLIGSFDFWSDFGSSFALLAYMRWALGSTYYSSRFTTIKWEVLLAAIRAGLVVKLLRMARNIRFLNMQRNLDKDLRLSEKSLNISKNKTVKKFRLTQLLLSKKKADESLDILQSKVGAAMAELTTARVISLVFILLVIIPLLSMYTDDKSHRIASTLVQDLGYKNYTDPKYFNDIYTLYLNNVISTTDVIGININGNWFFQNDKLESLRKEETSRFIYTTNEFYTETYFSQEQTVSTSTIYSLFLTLFVLFLILVGTYSFTLEIDFLVIKPIQRMVQLVQKIQINPLKVEYEMLGKDEGFFQGMETTLLLKTINKVGGLLKVVFGEAGSAIIAKNLTDSDHITLDRSTLLNAGTKIWSVFGFCDVRNFTDTTECLQEEVMLFVNRIAYILHSIVVQCSGAANKNIGDAFLLIWKIDDSLSRDEISEIADKALLAFCKTLIELSKQHDFICEFSPKATQLLKKKFPKYAVKIGCGLHFGWAIEGAIGTSRKIDASYLSPHVSFVEYLEQQTKLYDTAIIMSETFINLLTPEAANCCRQIDVVCRSDDEDPVKLYTYDTDLTINWDDIAIKYRKLPTRKSVQMSHKLQRKNSRPMSARHPPTATSMLTTRNSITGPQDTYTLISHSSRNNARRNDSKSNPTSINDPKTLRPQRSVNEKGVRQLFNDIESNMSTRKITENLPSYPPKIVIEKYSPIIWSKDDELRELRHIFTNDFSNAWSKGFEHYINGSWIEAGIFFEETLRLSNCKDGPSKYLLNIIQSHGSSPPYNWEGYRMHDEDQ